MTRASQSGTTRLAFTGKVGGRALAPGTYSVTITATVAGTSAGAQKLTFTITR